MLSPSNEMYHRAYPSVRSVPSPSNVPAMPSPSPRLAPLLPPAALDNLSSKSSGLLLNQSPVDVAPEGRALSKDPTLCGMPLKYVASVLSIFFITPPTDKLVPCQGLLPLLCRMRHCP